jgi:hypothetical protein
VLAPSSRFHFSLDFDSTLGYPGEGPPKYVQHGYASPSALNAFDAALNQGLASSQGHQLDNKYPLPKPQGPKMKYKESKARVLSRSVIGSLQRVQGENDGLREYARDQREELNAIKTAQNPIKTTQVVERDNEHIADWSFDSIYERPTTVLNHSWFSPKINVVEATEFTEISAFEGDEEDERMLSQIPGKLVYRNPHIIQMSAQSVFAYQYHLNQVLWWLQFISFICGVYLGRVHADTIPAIAYVVFVCVSTIFLIGSFKVKDDLRRTSWYKSKIESKNLKLLISKELIGQMSRVVADISQMSSTVAERIDNNILNCNQINIPRHTYAEVIRGTSYYIKCKFVHDKVKNLPLQDFRKSPTLNAENTSMDIMLMNSYDSMNILSKKEQNSKVSDLAICANVSLSGLGLVLSIMVLSFLILIYLTSPPTWQASLNAWLAQFQKQILEHSSDWRTLLGYGYNTISSLLSQMWTSHSILGLEIPSIPDGVSASFTSVSSTCLTAGIGVVILISTNSWIGFLPLIVTQVAAMPMFMPTAPQILKMPLALFRRRISTPPPTFSDFSPGASQLVAWVKQPEGPSCFSRLFRRFYSMYRKHIRRTFILFWTSSPYSKYFQALIIGIFSYHFFVYTVGFVSFYVYLICFVGLPMLFTLAYLEQGIPSHASVGRKIVGWFVAFCRLFYIMFIWWPVYHTCRYIYWYFTSVLMNIRKLVRCFTNIFVAPAPIVVILLCNLTQAYPGAVIYSALILWTVIFTIRQLRGLFTGYTFCIPYRVLLLYGLFIGCFLDAGDFVGYFVPESGQDHWNDIHRFLPPSPPVMWNYQKPGCTMPEFSTTEPTPELKNLLRLSHMTGRNFIEEFTHEWTSLRSLVALSFLLSRNRFMLEGNLLSMCLCLNDANLFQTCASASQQLALHILNPTSLPLNRISLDKSFDLLKGSFMSTVSNSCLEDPSGQKNSSTLFQEIMMWGPQDLAYVYSRVGCPVR